MTQGEILSHIAPIESLVGILDRMKGKSIGISEVNMTTPFINKAEKAAEKISRFALDNFNSIDANKRELANIVYNRFMLLYLKFDKIKKFKSRSSYDTTADFFNNRIQSIKDIIYYTIEAIGQLKDVLPPPDEHKGKNKSEGEDAPVQYIVNNVVIHKQNEGQIETEIDNSDQEDEEECEDSDEEGNENDGDEEIPEIFDKRIDEEKVIEEIENLKSDKVKLNRRWYVIFRVLWFLQWIGRSQTDFILWVKHHFGWEGEEEFRGVQSEFIHSEPNKWNTLTIKTKKGKKNKTIGPNYYEFAVTIRDAFVKVDASGEMHDYDYYLSNPNQGGIKHNNKWK